MFAFCKPVSSKKRFLPHRELSRGYSFTLFARADDVPAEEWNKVTGGDTVFLERDYLRIVEDGGHAVFSARYAIVYHKQEPCGILYFQVADFHAGVIGNLLNGQNENVPSRRFRVFENYLEANKDEVLLRLFTCGNNLVSGEFGYRFCADLNPQKANVLLLGIVDAVSKEEKLKGGLSAILIKDFYKAPEPADVFESDNYSAFHVEPNLIVDLPAGLQSLDDYLALFSKKYRNRAKSVLKSLSALELRQLTLADIRQQETAIFQLYEEVFEKARFKLIKLPQDYFSRVKALFPERFTVKGFFLEGRLVAFASSFLMPDGSIEAHYIGLDYNYNTEYCLYQNILYAMISEGIVNGSSAVNLGRTAAEIKTTVGARAHDLLCYIKPQNAISKWIQKPFISYLQPAEWTPRNPFKE